MKTFLFFFALTLRAKYEFQISRAWSFAWVGSVVVLSNVKTMKTRKVFQFLLDSSFVVSVN